MTGWPVLQIYGKIRDSFHSYVDLNMIVALLLIKHELRTDTKSKKCTLKADPQ